MDRVFANRTILLELNSQLDQLKLDVEKTKYDFSRAVIHEEKYPTANSVNRLKSLYALVKQAELNVQRRVLDIERVDMEVKKAQEDYTAKITADSHREAKMKEAEEEGEKLRKKYASQVAKFVKEMSV
jgi:hypothetical protein